MNRKERKKLDNMTTLMMGIPNSLTILLSIALGVFIAIALLGGC